MLGGIRPFLSGSETGQVVLSSSSVNVPSDFAGMQVLKAALPTGFTSQIARNWDQSNASSGTAAIVRYIGTSLGVFDWSRFDLFMSNNAGKKILFTLGQPADWMITRSAIGGANAGGKANMCPTGATELTTNYLPVVQAIATRARDTWGVTGIIWELWNEIEGPGMLATAELGALAPMAKVIGPAIKSIDATAIILTPSARDDDTAFLVGNFLAASDGSTGKGGDYVDGIAFHFYGLNSPWTYKYNCDVYRQKAIDAGYPGLPLYITESGMLSSTANSGAILQRRMAVFAACGAKCFIAYATDSGENPLGAYSAEWNAAVSALAGKTITQCTKNADGSVTVTANGATVTF